jgi:hypothetical protein
MQTGWNQLKEIFMKTYLVTFTDETVMFITAVTTTDVKNILEMIKANSLVKNIKEVQ